MSPRFLAWVCFGVLLPIWLGACAVDVSLDGKQCDEAHRCESGFVCRDAVCVSPTDNGQDGGIRADGGLDAGRADAGIDAGLNDAGARDAGGSDGGEPSSDAGTADAGALDAGIDAGPDEVAFVDDRADRFALGDTALGVSFSPDAGALVLDGSASGVFTSRLFDAQRTGHALALSWTPRAPYSKAIPSDVADDAEAQAYAAGGLDLTGLVFLLHADGTVGMTLPDGASLNDDSARSHPTSLVDLDVANDSRFVDGAFGDAVFLERDDYLRLSDSDTSADFAFGDAVFTFSGWAKIPGCGPSDDNVILLGGEKPHIWFGALCPSGKPHFEVHDDLGGGDGATAATLTIVDDNWHHLVGVKDTNPEQTRLYVDGALVASWNDTWGTFSNFTKELFVGEFPIGTFPNYTYSSTLAFDDLAVFDRALNEAEVRALYLRGALGLRLQVRACASADCTGVPFVGPDGTSATSFAEPARAPTANAPSAQVTPALSGRYFQYRAYFSSTASDETPAVNRVQLQIARP